MTAVAPIADGAASRRAAWTVARIALPAGTLVVLGWRLGAGPFVDGLRTLDAGLLAVAAALAAVTTVCCAWRWSVVARALGLDLRLAPAVAASYRSIFLNVALPGGILGDVHRGVSHGRAASDVGRGLRAVACERGAGQVVQAALTVAVLLVLPSPVRPSLPWIGLGLVAATAVAVLAARAWPRLRAAAARDVRTGLLARRAWPVVAVSSTLVVAGHATTFVLAARAVGATAPLAELLPLALLVLLGAALPNVGGWGPREGVTAWAFGEAGLGASRGVAAAVAYGVMVLVASLPGAAVLAAGWVRRDA